MIIECQKPNEIVKICASAKLAKESKYQKIVIRPITLKGKPTFQAEAFTDKQAFHQNFPFDNLCDWIEQNVVGQFKQILVQTIEADVTYLTSKNGKTTRIVKAHDRQTSDLGANNRNKKYLINEGDDVPALIELGIFTAERKVAAKMYDKFKQINRFLEILDDVFADYSAKTLTMLDFGSGKAYLSFIAYYYFSQIKHIDVEIIGYDLKADVVRHCNELARKFGYEKLHFVIADVTKDVLSDKRIDAVLSLHACDVATDYALNYVATHNVKYVFSVPCCQHEINNDIKRGGDLDVLLKYGIIKERVSALLTDSVLAMVLEDLGYKVDVLEFVDFAHSPKNLMIRAVLRGAANYKNKNTIENLQKRYGFTQTFAKLTYGSDD